MLSDFLYYAPNNESTPWLIYNISKPLIGSFDPGKIVHAVVPGQPGYPLIPHTETQEEGQEGQEENVSSLPKREVGSFRELLANFPMIARQMQPGLERLFREFGKELGKPLPPPPSRSPSISSRGDDRTLVDDDRSVRSSSTTRVGKLPFNSEEYFDDDENLMRRALETAVTAAIDLFRLVDKQQLSLLGATTDLTGPLVERLIERYVAEQVHDSLLFPRLCGCHEAEDSELDAHIRQMENIDVSQVGITIDGGRQGKEDLIKRLGKGVEEFRKMVEAKCPQDMLKALLATVQVVSMADHRVSTGHPDMPETEATGEKEPSPMTVNADILVSLLLMVVIRSHVRHLQARLAYMQHFVYIDDVESGEIGYALSTFEAVLTYLLRDWGGLRKSSVQNRRLWVATKKGRVSDMKAVLERHEKPESPDEMADSPGDFSAILNSSEGQTFETSGHSSEHALTNGTISESPVEETSQPMEIPETPTLSHVFPFQQWPQDSPPKNPSRPVKKVSMDIRSLSESSAISLLSRTTTLGSTVSGIEGDTSIESLTQTQDPAGDSVPMMAVEAGQPEALKYLLSLEEYYPPKTILEDTNSDGTTLLSAAVQLGHTELVDIILDFVFKYQRNHPVSWYFSKPDVRGRTVAHYLFSTPPLLSRLGTALPWRQKDRNGQTPLFALCRSYDHPEYKTMVNDALSIARESQGDGKPLRLDDHIDTRGNTLLHIVSDSQIILRILRECDCDPNATNDKKFTPLMMASKYGRVDLVRTFFQDPRVDVYLKELRGLTAVELAKDDDVRNRIDDLILLSNPPSSPSLDPSGRVTTVVRSFFVEDATVRFIIKSGAPNPQNPRPGEDSRPGTTTYTVTTCRRNLTDFENLAKWLAIEHPASYIPSISDFRPPFQIHSRPSRAVLHDIQDRLDRFLKIMLAHSTFATHEMLWEFFLMPEIQPEMMEERSRRKAVVQAESISDDYEPVNQEGIRDVEQIVSHAQEMVRSVNANTRSLIRRGHALQYATSDFADAVMLCATAISTLQTPTNALPASHVEAMNRFATYMSTSSSDSSPLIQFLTSVVSSHSTTTAILSSLARPTNLISTLNSTSRSLSRSRSALVSTSLPRKFNLNLPGLEESRQKSVRELEQKIEDTERQVTRLGKEIAWNKDVVVGELAGWTTWREKVGRDAIKTFVRASLVREQERGRRLERCLRNVREAKAAGMP